MDTAKDNTVAGREANKLIPLVDLRRYYSGQIGKLVKQAINGVIAKGNFVSGEQVELFESEWALKCGAKYCIGVSSGSDALYIILRYARERLGYSYVDTTAMTFWATVESALRNNFSVSLKDINLSTGMPEPFPNDWVPVNRVFLSVSLYGYPAMLPNKDTAGGLIVEDLSHAHGHKLRGWAAAFSHYPTKNLPALGQAGSIVTNDSDLYDYARVLRTHGEKGGRFRHEYVAGNMRLDEIQAAVLRVNLTYLDWANNNRRAIAQLYREQLADCTNVQLLDDHPEHTYHIFGLLTSQRDALAVYLKKHGIQTGIRYGMSMNCQPAFIGKFNYHHLPNAEVFAHSVLNLPIYPDMDKREVKYICEKIKRWTP